MSIRNLSALAAVLALVVAIPVQAMTERERERLAEYERFAGEPVADMPFWRLQSYESLGNEAVVVWTAVNKAWLIKVLPPCTDLPWAKAVGLSSNNHRVSAKFDHVVAGQDRCNIASIQAVDYKAMREASRAKKDAGEK